LKTIAPPARRVSSPTMSTATMPPNGCVVAVRLHSYGLLAKSR
jgi:hypothetical protein